MNTLEIRTAYEEADNYDPWEELAKAIIKQAAMDYIRAGRKMTRSENPLEHKELSEYMKSISRFFLSDWYSVLSGNDNGADIIERMDREVFGKDDCA